MAVVDDDMNEVSISSIILNTRKSNQDALSAEDVAWVDSCLESDILDSDWTSMKDALLNILGSQPDSLNTASAEPEPEPEPDDISTTDIEILPSSVDLEAETAQSLLITDNDLVSIDEEADNTENSFKNAFLPGSTDGILQSENIDSGFSTYDIDVSTDDVFRVWDLDIPTEEDELVEQLKKALAGSSFKLTPSPSDDSGICKELKEDTLDDLIAGITELSLTPKSN